MGDTLAWWPRCRFLGVVAVVVVVVVVDIDVVVVGVVERNADTKQEKKDDETKAVQEEKAGEKGRAGAREEGRDVRGYGREGERRGVKLGHVRQAK